MEGFMKKFMVLTALLVSGAVLAQNIHQASDDTSRGQSLVKDGTFQVDRKQNFFGSWLANFKLLEQNPGLVALDETVSVKDGQSIRLSNPKGPNVGLMQTVHGIKPATKYRLSYYLKYTDINPDKVEGFGGVVLNVWHAGNKWFPARPFTGTSDWKRHEFTYTTDAKAAPELSLSLLIINGRGTAWFDDVQMVEVK